MKINKQVLFIVSFIFICHLIDKILNKDIIEGFIGEYYYDEFKLYLVGIFNYYFPCSESSYRNSDTLKCEYTSCFDRSINIPECEYYSSNGETKRRPCHLITQSHVDNSQFCQEFVEETCPPSRCIWDNDNNSCNQKNFCNLQEDVCEYINDGIYIIEEKLNEYLIYDDPIKEFC